MGFPVKHALSVLVIFFQLLGPLAPIGALVRSAEGAQFGWLGVRIRDLSEGEMEEVSSRHGIQEGFGVMIVEVLGETPAARSGLKNGDLVVAFRERPLIDTRSLQQMVSSTPTGEEVTLTVLRNEGRRPIRVRVGAMPPGAVADRVAAEFGFSVRESFLDPDRGGRDGHAIVAGVLSGGPAERAGLKAGDLILGVNGDETLSRRDVGLALGRAALDRPLRLLVGRDTERIPLTLESPLTPPPSRRN